MNNKQCKRLRKQIRALSNAKDVATYQDVKYTKHRIDMSGTTPKPIVYEVYTSQLDTTCKRYYYKISKRLFKTVPKDKKHMVFLR